MLSPSNVSAPSHSAATCVPAGPCGFSCNALTSTYHYDLSSLSQGEMHATDDASRDYYWKYCGAPTDTCDGSSDSTPAAVVKDGNGDCYSLGDRSHQGVTCHTTTPIMPCADLSRSCSLSVTAKPCPRAPYPVITLTQIEPPARRAQGMTCVYPGGDGGREVTFTFVCASGAAPGVTAGDAPPELAPVLSGVQAN